MTKQLFVGKVPVGGGAPVSIQSMCNTKTDDVAATVAQIKKLEAAGCEIIRVAIPDQAAAEAVDKIKEQIDIPLIADIHFNYKFALECAERGIDAIRINPGNIGGEDKVKAVADMCNQKRIPIRIGVNGGSLEKELRAKYGGVTAEALVESAMGHVHLLNKFDFDDICISVKCSDVPLTMRAYTLLSQQTDSPLPLGVTEAVTDLPVLRPLIGIDKVEIIRLSRRIGTYETSILPYEDCCTVFTPRHPCTRPVLAEVEAAEAALDVEALMAKALSGIKQVRIKADGTMTVRTPAETNE